MNCVDCGVAVSKLAKRCKACKRKYHYQKNKKLKNSGVNCSRCGIWTGKPGTCAACNAYVKRWRREHPERYKKINGAWKEAQKAKRKPDVDERRIRSQARKQREADSRLNYRAQLVEWQIARYLKHADKRMRIYDRAVKREERIEAKKERTRTVYLAQEIAKIEARAARKIEKLKAKIAAWEEASKRKKVERMAQFERRMERAFQLEKTEAERKRIKRAKKRAQRRAIAGKLSKGLAIKLLKLQKGKCVYCRTDLGESYEMDHVMPLARGGMNEDSNIQLLCRSCNASKGYLHPQEFAQKRNLLL